MRLRRTFFGIPPTEEIPLAPGSTLSLLADLGGKGGGPLSWPAALVRLKTGEATHVLGRMYWEDTRSLAEHLNGLCPNLAVDGDSRESGSGAGVPLPLPASPKPSDDEVQVLATSSRPSSARFAGPSTWPRADPCPLAFSPRSSA